MLLHFLKFNNIENINLVAEIAGIAVHKIEQLVFLSLLCYLLQGYRNF